MHRDLRAVLRETAVRMMNLGETSEAAIVAAARAEHPEKFDAEVEAFIERGAISMVRRILGTMTADDDNTALRLPGFEMPTAICLRYGDGPTKWILSSQATWAHLMMGRELRAENVARAQHRLDQYDEGLERLRPYMEGRPLVTVADAVAEMEGDDADDDDA